MQVDNSVPHPPYFSSANLNDFSDIFNADLFADDLVNGTLNGNNSNSPATASSSRGSSPQSPYQSSLLTPPQPSPVHAFPEYNPSSFFGFEDDIQAKTLDPMMNMPYDFYGAFAGAEMGLDGAMSMDLSMDIGTGIVGETMGIDPQLVGTPSALSDIGEENENENEPIEKVEAEHDHDGDADVSASPSSAGSPPAATTTKTTKGRSLKRKEKEMEPEEEKEKLTLVIQPVKVAGHGKARKGTIQSGGIVKKAPSPNPVAASLGKENSYNISTPFIVPPTYTPSNSYQPTNVYNQGQKKGPTSEGGKDDEDDDELPQDWRPSPEVFAKMTSKEKRQLRNKISARNFRVRRKEYISTLEGDIAERDRLLDAIRSELGSTQSENLALRQEIATLKRTLLEGRTPSTDGLPEFPLLNLPPPAPLPAQSAAVTLQAQAQALSQQQAAQAQAQSSPLLTPNTQKDASKNGRFWGGVRLGGMGMGMGGITPVHRVVLPEVSVADLLHNQFSMSPSPFVTPKDEKWKENVNPLLNSTGIVSPPSEKVGNAKEKSEKEKEKVPLGFEGFADVNPFTMKTLDAYRMHLWGKMASQHPHSHQQHQPQPFNNHHHLTGLASSLRPAFFTSPTTSPLASLLAGKHSSPAPPYSHAPSSTPGTPPPPYTSPPSSPLLVGKGGVVEKLERERRELQREKEREKERERERTEKMYAALASQTLLRKLGGAFWDAFSGSSSSSSSSSSGLASSSSSSRAWDADKVRRVLEGKAVVRVVDIDEPSTPVVKAPVVQQHEQHEQAKRCYSSAAECGTALLEQSMRSLTLSKKP